MKFRKAIAMCLAMVMTVSVMSVSAFAAGSADNTEGEPSNKVTRSGVLPNGIAYEITALTPEEIAEMEALEATNGGISRASSTDDERLIWSGKVSVPIQNPDGTNGKQLGTDFSINPHTKVEIRVGRLPSAMETVNIGIADTDGMWKDWETPVFSNEKIAFYPYKALEAHRYVVTVSTQENESRTASFAIYSMSE